MSCPAIYIHGRGCTRIREVANELGVSANDLPMNGSFYPGNIVGYKCVCRLKLDEIAENYGFWSERGEDPHVHAVVWTHIERLGEWPFESVVPWLNEPTVDGRN